MLLHLRQNVQAHRPTEAMGVRTVLLYQVVGETRYFDAAGTIGRTLGLDPVR